MLAASVTINSQHLMSHTIRIVLIATLSFSGLVARSFADEPDAAQRAKDARIVQTLLRLSNVDLSTKPEAKASVLRYLETVKDSDEARYLELVARFELKETRDELLRLAVEQSDNNTGVEAARLLVKFGEQKLLAKTLAGPDDASAAKLLQALGLAGDARVNELLLPLVSTSSDASAPLRCLRALSTARAC